VKIARVVENFFATTGTVRLSFFSLAVTAACGYASHRQVFTT
jgi:hypothetical protein